MVFIDDQGRITQVLNPGKIKGGMGKKVKVRGEMKKKDGKDMMEVYNLLEIFG